MNLTIYFRKLFLRDLRDGVVVANTAKTVSNRHRSTQGRILSFVAMGTAIKNVGPHFHTAEIYSSSGEEMASI